MARRLCLEERARIEAMAQAGFDAAEIAGRLGRCRSTVQREMARNGGPRGYRAGDAPRSADGRARRPRAPKLARDRVLASAVAERLEQRSSPHAISADLGTRGLGVCAETVYRACYGNSGETGLGPGSWNKLPRQLRRRKPRGRTEQAKRCALGEFRPLVVCRWLCCELPPNRGEVVYGDRWCGPVRILPAGPCRLRSALFCV